MKQCASCGADLQADWQFCMHCGHAQETVENTLSTNNPSGTQVHKEVEVPNPQHTGAIFEFSQTQPPLKKAFSPTMKVALLTVISLIILGVAGSGIVYYYILTRPDPVIHISSKYRIGSTLAGATGTTFHIVGSRFSSSSVISILLDGQLVPLNTTIRSDTGGNVNADLPITNDWPLGFHVLTAKDADNYTTKLGFAIYIAQTGQIYTPGPHGIPPDNASFQLSLTFFNPNGSIITPHDDSPFRLTVSEQLDPTKSQVCSSHDNYEQTRNYSMGDAGQIKSLGFTTCSGTYKNGEITFIQTVQSWKLTFPDDICELQEPSIYLKLQGAFVNEDTIEGSGYVYEMILPCRSGTPLYIDAQEFTWKGNIVKK